MSANGATDREGSQLRQHVLDRLVRAAFAGAASIRNVTDAGEGRGIFSDVLRLELSGLNVPETVVAKLPAAGSNGEAAIASGAVGREAFAYRDLLAEAPVRSPRLFAIHEAGSSISFLFEDLGHRRAVDQLDGLGREDTIAVVSALAHLHAWQPAQPPDIRVCTPALFDPEALERGLDLLEPRWGLTADITAAFRHLLDRRTILIESFAALPSTLCHGDVRADNLVFDPDGVPVLFDWQQIAWQTGAADVAWLLATSLEPEVRRAVRHEVTSAYAQARDTTDELADAAIRLGYVLPGLAVLMLAQRASTNERTRAFIRTSVERIGLAVVEDGPV